MTWRRQPGSKAHQYGWLAGRMVDEALRVFGALETACVEDGRLDAGQRAQFRAAALGILDDVADLAPLVVTAPAWPMWPHDHRGQAADGCAETPALEAVQALATYTGRLAAIAGVLAARDDAAATVFVGLAAAAEARMEVLAS